MMANIDRQINPHGKSRDAILDMQNVFVSGLAEGMRPTAAAKLAGYRDPGHAQADLLNNERVLKQLVQIYREKSIAWRRLHEKAKFGLDAALDPDNWESTVQIAKGKSGKEFTVIIPPKANMGNVISAAKAVLEVLSKVDRGALSDQADEQDEADRASLVSAARKVLQSHEQPAITDGKAECQQESQTEGIETSKAPINLPTKDSRNA